ncbi:hypothetical protein CYD30_23670 [Kosakonia cowanii]|nr:hypothetical protein CYD30_23670 [Kosakonia cowanii]
MFLRHWFAESSNECEYEARKNMREVKRLQLLENGVKNYSGGIFKLHDRVRSVLMSKDIDPVEILSLLKDLSLYFRDLKIVGRLEEDPSTPIKSIIN